MFPLMMTAAGLWWLALLAIYFLTFRAGVTDFIRKTVMFGLLAVTLAIYVSQYVMGVTGMLKLWVTTGFLQILIRDLAAATPGGALSVWGVCALLLVGGYLLVQARFQHIEAVVVPPSCTLL